MPKLNPREEAARAELFANGFLHCTKCDTTKSVDDFHRDKSRWSGRRTQCRDCVRAYAETYTRDGDKIASQREEAAELRKRDLKRCGSCDHIKNRDSFTRRSDSPDGLHTSCSSCCSRISRESYQRRAAVDPFGLRLRQGRQRAEAAGRPFEYFTSDELFDYWRSRGIDPWVCVWTGERLTPETVQWDHLIALSHPESPGNVMHNLRPSSAGANNSKHGKHFVEFLADREGKQSGATVA